MPEGASLLFGGFTLVEVGGRGDSLPSVSVYGQQHIAFEKWPLKIDVNKILAGARRGKREEADVWKAPDLPGAF